MHVLFTAVYHWMYSAWLMAELHEYLLNYFITNEIIVEIFSRCTLTLFNSFNS